eukprot:CAMPEP_0113307242 /NCGR_PEP_ID=MMETSP0010_2-20120614/6166_1 /TAXON_ID=216773 ORGANISM="Corethron hystrix, Strain 308" /NCGR_SAMPLE_ID=MMETSP0010_2 /ASSEMBLY_ACC=CAM_ASM_000155 /LENGTH=403 /DNA_ID=CAMNT_0000162059 /DNA_START=95 /DNA_END=1306 /DNA_ORIENTATION=+ /assembly_acc=CAM_ASM_000155
MIKAAVVASLVGGASAFAPSFGISDSRVALQAKQDFLEASPYWDQTAVPVNTAKPKAPHTGKVVSNKRIVGPKATGETCHIIIDHNGELPYWEGQSFGVVPPGNRAKDGKPHSVRLYSIAASRYGDDMSGKTTSLCVRRATYWCPELQADDPAKKGICSNFLCDAQPGEEIALTGPSGKVMLLPEDKPEADIIMVAIGTGIAPYRSFIRRLFEEDTEAAAAYKGVAWLFLGVANSDALLYDDEWQTAKAKAPDIIMVATGTGIAPYRSFIRRLFEEDTEAAAAYKGVAWLFLGVANSDALLYDDEWQTAKAKAPDNFRLDYALSREQENKKGGKMYIQDKVEEYADEIFTRLDSGAHIYFCGLKGMMPGIQDMLKEVCTSKGIEYDQWLKGLKKAKQWHVEVY